MKKLIILFIIYILNVQVSEVSAKEKKDVIHYFRILHKDTLKSLKEQLKVNNDPVSYEVKDIQNGYLKYSFAAAEGFNEFVIWKKKNGNIIAGEVFYGCGPGCTMSGFRLTEFDGDSPKDVTSKYYPEKEVQKLYKEKLKKLQTKDSEKTEGLWINLPRKGTSAEIGIMQDTLELKGFQSFAELQFKNDRLEFKKK